MTLPRTYIRLLNLPEEDLRLAASNQAACFCRLRAENCYCKDILTKLNLPRRSSCRSAGDVGLLYLDADIEPGAKSRTYSNATCADSERSTHCQVHLCNPDAETAVCLLPIRSDFLKACSENVYRRNGDYCSIYRGEVKVAVNQANLRLTALPPGSNGVKVDGTSTSLVYVNGSTHVLTPVVQCRIVALQSTAVLHRPGCQ